MANLLQARAIERYHRHLQGLGRAGRIDDTARVWVRRYAHLWRQRFDAARPPVRRPSAGRIPPAAAA